LPANALVTTYTYAPLIGITSQTDPNGRTTYYEYDAFNRLKRIKDHDGNTVKVMDYQYQKPITQ
jgi:YD repeat-containing protein